MKFLASNWIYIVLAGVIVYMMVKRDGLFGKHFQNGGCCGSGYTQENHISKNYGFEDEGEKN